MLFAHRGRTGWRGVGFAAPVLLVAWIVASAPFLGRLTRWLQQEVDRSLLIVVPAVLFWLAAAALVLRIVRSARRFGLANLAALAVSLLWAAVQATALARGRPEESALERMHLVLYGLVALLLCRSLLRIGRSPVAAGGAALLLTTLAGLLDEFVQWLVWVRVGDFHDCLLNASAAGCGALLGMGLFCLDRGSSAPDASRPASSAAAPSPDRRFGLQQAGAWLRPAGSRHLLASSERRGLAVLWIVLVVASAGLVALTNLGHRHVDAEFGSFRSYFSADRLDRLDRNRQRRWATRLPPMVLQPWHVEDHFLSEAAWHVQARNEAFDAGDFSVAAAEEGILRRYYPAVLALRTPDGHLRHALPPERALRLVEEDAVPDAARESAAGGGRIWIWPPFLLPGLAAVGLLAAVPLLPGRRGIRRRS